VGETTGITWTDSTINVWVGCTKVSAGCANCYAEVSTPARVKRAAGLEVWGKDAARSETKGWEASLRKWQRQATATNRMRAIDGQPPERWRVFGQSLSDTFEDRADLDSLRSRFFAAIEAAPALTFQLLTKRPENVLRMVPPSWRGGREQNCRVTDAGLDAPDGAVVDGWTRTGDVWLAPEPKGWPAHVWIGCTVESQAMAEERIPHLLRVPAPTRFLSVEPQIEAVDLAGWLGDRILCGDERCMARHDHGADIAWVIQGGESGSRARPFDLAWARSMRDRCKAAGVAYFLKQLGAYIVDGPEKYARLDNVTRVRHSHGGDEGEWPADLRNCRAFPEVPSG
jgi:protein gp37